MPNELAFRPTLIVGVGGTGCQIAETVYRRSQLSGASLAGRVQVIGFDTDENDMRRRKALSDQQRIKFSSNDTVEELLDRHRSVEGDWFVDRKSLPMELRKMTMQEGAAQIRMFTRLALHDAMSEERIQNAIATAVRTLAQRDNALGYTGSINVLVVGSLAGATGSGSFLQIAMLINDICTKSNIDASTRGLFMLPDIYVSTGALAQGQIPNVLANGYASIKEFHAVNLQANERAGRYDFEYEYAPGRKLASGTIPFLTLSLIDYEDMKGSNLGRSIEAYRTLAEDAAYTLMFSPIGQKASSGAINDARQRLAVAGRGSHDTIAAIGLSSLTYPHDEIVEYLGMQLARDVLSGDWLRLDESFRSRLSRFRAQRQAGNATVREPEIGESYLADIKQFALDDNLAFFREIWEELHPVLPNSDGEESNQPLYERYLDALEKQLIQAFWNRSALVDASQRRTVDVDQFAARKAISETVRRHEQRLDDDLRNIDRELQTAPTDILVNLLTTSDDSGEADWRDHHLQSFLVRGGPHLVRNRAFLYGLRQLLQARIAELNPDETRKRLYRLANSFEPERGQSPTSRGTPVIMSQASELANAGLFKKMTGGGHAKWVEDYVTFFNGSQRTIKSLAEERLKQKAFELLADEVDEQLRVLSGLFLEVDAAKARLSTNIRDEERRHQVGASFKNRLYVCADENSKRQLWEELRDAAAGQRLAPDANKALALEAYRKARRNRMARRPESMEDLRDMFWATVVENFAIKRVREDFRAVHAMSLMQAIEREFDFVSGDIGSERRKAAIAQRLGEMIRVVQKQSEPMIMLTKPTDGQQVRLWPINPELKKQMDVFENVDTMVSAGEQGSQSYTEEEFSMNELTCVTFRYNLEVAHLAKFGPPVRDDGSVAPDRAGQYFLKYQEMVDEIVSAASETRLARTITPHVHRDWHKPGILPEIVEGETKRLVSEVNRAFMAALLLDDLSFTEQHNKRVVEVSTVGKVPSGSVAIVIAEGHVMYDAVRAFERHPEAARACMNHWKHELKKMATASSKELPKLLTSIESGSAIAKILMLAESRDDASLRDERVRDLVQGHAMLAAEAIAAFRPDLPPTARLAEADRMSEAANAKALSTLAGGLSNETLGVFRLNSAKGLENWRRDNKLV